jgi:hypothetical protein
MEMFKKAVFSGITCHVNDYEAQKEPAVVIPLRSHDQAIRTT